VIELRLRFRTKAPLDREILEEVTAIPGIRSVELK
jgi:hypothetical protein